MTSESTGHVVIANEEGVLIVRMHRPEKKNALTRAMYNAISEALLAADQDDSVRVVLLTGTSDCFTSGNDLSDFRNIPSGVERPRNSILNSLPNLKKPIIAAVNGFAVGVGTTMLLHCDLVYAGQSARFQLPFVNLGLCPELGSSFLLPLLAGHQKASELLLLGEQFGAETAQQAGIVNTVCPDDKTYETALGKAKQLAGQPAGSVRLTKSLLKRTREQWVKAAIEEEVSEFNVRLQSPEAKEAFKAFAERRKPDFRQFA